MHVAPLPPVETPLCWLETENWSQLCIDFSGSVQDKILFVVVDLHSELTEAFSLHSALPKEP